MIYRLLFLFLLSLFITPELSFSQDSLKTVAIIKQLEEKRRLASLKGDIQQLSEILDPEFYEIGRLGNYRTRDLNIRERKSGKLQFDSLFFDSLQVKVFGDVAIATGIVHGNGQYYGEPFEQPQIRYSRIYMYRKNKWQIIFAQNTTIAGN